jgi:hypothetical protein
MGCDGVMNCLDIIFIRIIGEQVGPAALAGPVAGASGVIACVKEVDIFDFWIFGLAGRAAEDAGGFDGVEKKSIVCRIRVEDGSEFILAGGMHLFSGVFIFNQGAPLLSWL